MTLEQMKAVVATLKQNATQPFKVADERQAAEMTAADPLGYKWSVGEQYYKLCPNGVIGAS